VYLVTIYMTAIFAANLGNWERGTKEREEEQ
jgi:hypothetical protein